MTSEPSGPLRDAEEMLGRFESLVEGLASGPPGVDRAPALVVAGKVSALLGLVETDADPAVRRRVAGLRARQEAALLRLGGLGGLGGTPAAVPPRQGLVIDLSGLRGPEGLRGLGRAVTTSLMVMGVLLLAFAVYSVAFGHLLYERDQRLMLDRLNRDFQESAAIAAASVAGDRNLAAAPARGTPVALLEIPRIGVREVVVQGTGTKELRNAIGHYRPSPMPGQVGNAVLAGHRNLYGRPFARLGELRAGDTIAVTTQEGRFSYTVELSESAGTGDQDFLSQGTFVNRLTLLTTAPHGEGGRFAVVSKLQGNAAALKIRDDRQLKSDELGLGRDSSGWWPTLGWGLAMLGTLVVTSLLYRRWRRVSTYLITTPPLLAVGLLWFESVARLIPSTF
ncbi:hypothetical protein DPM19_30650 [Actinomadura craniellae]|uniref:Sortase n=1 Tax=Actinomadura craniellae TaxID=2231787 RepID=A0A365GX43_9ACTN|nr:sortase [Actinomadura craniellae]RAY11386.1 hypothetical protein DPM19_30650 [Actinomadura craniellae]